MTLDQKRYRVAELLTPWRMNRTLGNPCPWLDPDAWVKGDPGNGGDWMPPYKHPIPDTLDGIAALWEQHCPNTPITVQRHRRDGETWRWNAYTPDNIGIGIPNPHTEYEARLTLLLAVLEAKGKQ